MFVPLHLNWDLFGKVHFSTMNRENKTISFVNIKGNHSKKYFCLNLLSFFSICILSSLLVLMPMSKSFMFVVPEILLRVLVGVLCG